MRHSARVVVAALLEGDGDPRYDYPPDLFRVRFTFQDKPVVMNVTADSKEGAVNKALKKAIYSVSKIDPKTGKADPIRFRQAFMAAHGNAHATATVSNLTAKRLAKQADQSRKIVRPPVQQDLGL